MKPYIKPISIIISLILVCFMLGGCRKVNSASPTAIAEKLVAQGNMTGLSPLSGDKFESYFEFKNSDVKRFSVMISSVPDYSDTVAVFEVKNSEKRSLVISGISKYISTLASSMQTIETERKKISSSILMEMDNLIILIICSDTTSVEQTLEEMGAKAIY